MAIQYLELVGIVEEIEKASTRSETSFIDISLIAKGKETHQKPQFSSLLKEAVSMESLHYIDFSQKGKPQPRQPNVQVAQSQPRQSVTAQISPPQQPRQTVQQVQQPQAKQKPSPPKSIKNEIGVFAKSVAEGVEKPITNVFEVKAKNEEDLVLPKLSISDQIAELQRIIEGLNERVFSMEQVSIIKKEVYGLKREIEEGESLSYGRESESIGQSLIDLRNRRIQEAIAAFGGGR